MATTPTAPAQPETAVPQTTPAPAVEQAVFNQSYSFKIPKNQEGVQEIFKDPTTGETNWKALVYALRAGIKQIVNNRVRQKFTEKEKDTNKVVFEPVEGMFDATSLLLDAPIRNVLSQRDKLIKNLKASNLPQSVIDTMLVTFDQNVGTGEAEAGNTAVQTNEAKVSWSKDGKKLIMTVGSSSDEDEEEEEEETAA